MSAYPKTADHILQLLEMREHYLTVGSALRVTSPLDRDALRYAAIILRIDELIADLRKYAN
ncbi:MAG: hypothetical protein Q8R33_15490 [Burkholderiales bacterium]|nr:hypothetical protein [Burkholderiales bacterium]